MCKNGGLLVAYDEKQKRALVTDADCGSWQCDECKMRMRNAWIRRAQHGAKMLQEEGKTLYFATLTSHERNTTFEQCAKVFPSAWKKLHKALDRRCKKQEYLLIPEKHKDGRMHMHAIWTYDVKTRWLKDEARASGLGYIAQIGRRGHIDEMIEDVTQVGIYAAKYLGKDLGKDMPKRFRRVRTSQGWPDALETNSDLSVLEWKYVGTNGQLYSVYVKCKEGNYDLVDVRTGELFEDVDLGTTTLESLYS